MGDLKLFGAVGAWIGCTQLREALMVATLAGGVVVLMLAEVRGALLESLGGTGSLADGWRSSLADRIRL